MKEHLGWIKRILRSDETGTAAETNAATLREMAAEGDDLAKTRDVDFTHLFSHEVNAIAFLEAVQERDYNRCSHEFWRERVSWITSIRVRMAPSLEEINAIEAELDEIAASFEGRSDGWGCMKMTPSPTE